jgi:hypothetical protein
MPWKDYLADPNCDAIVRLKREGKSDYAIGRELQISNRFVGRVLKAIQNRAATSVASPIFSKCSGPTPGFDSAAERSFAVLLEMDQQVLKWFKPGRGKNDRPYEPDFVAETKDAKFLCEVKSAYFITNETVREKARTAVAWCEYATKQTADKGGKPWTYLLIPHEVIDKGPTLQLLVEEYALTSEEIGIS